MKGVKARGGGVLQVTDQTGAAWCGGAYLDAAMAAAVTPAGSCSECEDDERTVPWRRAPCASWMAHA